MIYSNLRPDELSGAATAQTVRHEQGRQDGDEGEGGQHGLRLPVLRVAASGPFFKRPRAARLSAFCPTVAGVRLSAAQGAAEHTLVATHKTRPHVITNAHPTLPSVERVSTTRNGTTVAAPSLMVMRQGW